MSATSIDAVAALPPGAAPATGGCKIAGYATGGEPLSESTGEGRRHPYAHREWVMRRIARRH
jgi:hypothetical protein